MNSIQTEIITKPELKSVSLEDFEQQIDAYSQHLKAVDTKLQLISLMTGGFKSLCTDFMEQGDTAEQFLLNPTADTPITESYLLNHDVAEDFKSILILHRDVFLELNKVSILSLEHAGYSKKEINHFESSVKLLITQLEMIQKTIASKKRILEKNPKTDKKLRRQLTLVQNPWSVYKAQYEVVLSQFSDIETTTQKLKKTVGIFEDLKSATATITENNILLNNQLQQNIEHISKHLKDESASKELSDFIDTQISRDASLGTDQELLTENLNETIQRLEKMKVPIGSEEGLMVVREIDFNKRVQKWFDYQIVPDVMDLLAIETSIKSIHGISLTNLRNNLQVSKNDTDDKNISSVRSHLQTLKSELEDLKFKGELIIERIESHVISELKVENLLMGKPFLELPFNSALTFDSDSFLTKLRQPFEKGRSFFDSQFYTTSVHQATSDSELATKCLQYRMHKEENDHYDALFLNKKFIGDLFLVSRDTQDETLKIAIDQWQQGFNKSVLVYGERLSGRSTFLDYTSKKYFGKQVVILQPNNEATIDGRKFKTTYNLKDALQYIKKNNIQSTRPIIVIDDLELWRDSAHSLLDNVRALIDFIETESDAAFVLVSTNRMMLLHLDKRLTFSKTFSTVIDVSETEKTQIQKALLLRHGAAHRVLVNEKSEAIKDKKIRKNIDQMSNRYDNNIGDVLQAWTYHTFVQEQERMLFKDEDEDFPDLFTQQELMILKQASLFKKVTELGLKGVTANGFDTGFKSAIKRLVNLKVLLRNSKGDLYINPVVLKDVNLFIKQRN